MLAPGGDFAPVVPGDRTPGKRMIARQSRSVAGTGFFTLTRRRRVAGRCAAGMTDVVALRGNRGNRRTRMRGDDAGTAHLRRVRGRRNGGMAVIVVERQRRIFRRYSHVLRLLRRRRHVLLVDGGNLLRRRLRCRATGAPIVTHVGDVVARPMTTRPVQHGGGVELDPELPVDPNRRQCFALEPTAEVASSLFSDARDGGPVHQGVGSAFLPGG